MAHLILFRGGRESEMPWEVGLRKKILLLLIHIFRLLYVFQILCKADYD